MSTNNTTTTTRDLNPTYTTQVEGAKKALISIINRYGAAYQTSLPANDKGHGTLLMDAMQYAADLHARGKQTLFHSLWENWKADNRNLSMLAYVAACTELGIKTKVNTDTAKVSHLYRATLGLDWEPTEAQKAAAMDLIRGQQVTNGQMHIISMFVAGVIKAEEVYSPRLRALLGLQPAIEVGF